MDLAASVQAVTEEIMLRMARHVHEQTGLTRLCLAGGVALNCVANGRILREGPYDEIWIQPAAGDAGGALGVALFIWHQLLGKPREANRLDCQQGSLLGPAFLGATRFAASSTPREPATAGSTTKTQLCDYVADLIAYEKVVGWLHGRMEFGPRALGGRSILGDARSTRMQSVMNLKIKFRESFRPFAPSVLEERVDEYFEMRRTSPAPTCCWSRPSGRQAAAVGRARSAARGHRQVADAALRRSGDHARRLFSPRPDRRPRPAPALLATAEAVRGPDRFPGDHQHQLQRPRRTHRLLARTRLSLLHGHQHGRPGAGGFCGARRRAAARSNTRSTSTWHNFGWISAPGRTQMYNSMTCSPPCSGLPINRWLTGSTTKSMTPTGLGRSASDSHPATR